MNTLKITLTLLMIVASTDLLANVEIYEYEIINFEQVGEKEVLIKIQRNHGEKESYNVRVIFRPRCYSRLETGTSIEEEEKIFHDSIAYIKEKMKESKTILLGRKSGTGFLPNPEAKGEHIAETIRLLNTGNELIPYFQHHDLGAGLCKHA